VSEKKSLYFKYNIINEIKEMLLYKVEKREKMFVKLINITIFASPKRK